MIKTFLTFLLLFVATSVNAQVAVGIDPTARGIANKALNNQNSILSTLPQTSATTDYTAVLNTQLAAGRKIWLPYTDTPYQISGGLVAQAGASLVCDQGVIIKQTANLASNAWNLIINGAGVSIRDCQFDQQNKTGEFTLVQASDFSWVGGGATNFGYIRVNPTGTNASFDRLKVSNARDLSFYVYGVAGTSITNTECQNGGNLCIFASAGANNFYFAGNRTDGNRAELVGLDWTTYNGRVIGNYASGTGDNCFSITGSYITVTGNIANGCAFSGIKVYGSYNTVTGNIGKNNGRAKDLTYTYYNAADSSSYAGISVCPDFGGAGQHNTITGNFGEDDRTVKYQAYGVALYCQYTNWSAGETVTAGTYRYWNSNIYKFTVGGTTGVTAPTFTSGSQADGTATIAFIQTTPDGAREPSSNIVGLNHVKGAAVSPFLDNTTNTNNTVITDSSVSFNYVTGGTSKAPAAYSRIPLGFSSRATVWASGTTVTYGSIRSNAGRIYRVSNAGGTSTTAPTHSSGTATLNGIVWTYIGLGRDVPAISLNSDGRISALGPINIQPVDSTTTSVQLFSGSGDPENVVTAPVGSLYLRTDGGASTTLYVKTTGTSSTGWTAK